MDKQAPHRFIPKSEKIGEIATGTFTKAMLDLEQRRYPDIGTWETNGPPSNAMIHQLPLAPLPLDLQPRPSTGQYRFANLGAVYTISHKAKGESNNLEKMLILYGLRAGEIAQQVRYEAICRESENSLNEDGWDAGTTECRLSVSRHLPTESWDPSECDAKKIDKEWKKNIDGGLCLLVGSLLLHHHWWLSLIHISRCVLSVAWIFAGVPTTVTETGCRAVSVRGVVGAVDLTCVESQPRARARTASKLSVTKYRMESSLQMLFVLGSAHGFGGLRLLILLLPKRIQLFNLGLARMVGARIFKPRHDGGQHLAVQLQFSSLLFSEALQSDQFLRRLALPGAQIALHFGQAFSRVVCHPVKRLGKLRLCLLYTSPGKPSSTVSL